jgi:hypothetical protein
MLLLLFRWLLLEKVPFAVLLLYALCACMLEFTFLNKILKKDVAFGRDYS